MSSRRHAGRQKHPDDPARRGPSGAWAETRKRLLGARGGGCGSDRRGWKRSALCGARRRARLQQPAGGDLRNAGGHEALAAARAAGRQWPEPRAPLDSRRSAGRPSARAGLTRQLLAFSRQQVLAPRVLDLNDAVDRGRRPDAARLIGEDIDAADRVPATPLRCDVDPGRSSRCSLNLRGQRARRDARRRHASRSRAVSSPTAVRWRTTSPREPALRSCLTVTDTGAALIERRRPGAGLRAVLHHQRRPASAPGLANDGRAGAVEQNGGSIDVVSGRDGGSDVLHPPPREAWHKAARRSRPTCRVAARPCCSWEDEAAVREVTREQLESLGYRVLSCADRSARGLRGSRRSAAPAADRRGGMPGMNGRELRAPDGGRPGLEKCSTPSGYGET